MFKALRIVKLIEKDIRMWPRGEPGKAEVGNSHFVEYIIFSKNNEILEMDMVMGTL